LELLNKKYIFALLEFKYSRIFGEILLLLSPRTKQDVEFEINRFNLTKSRNIAIKNRPLGASDGIAVSLVNGIYHHLISGIVFNLKFLQMRNMINCDLENHFFDIDNMRNFDDDEYFYHLWETEQEAETVLMENRIYKKDYNIYE
jgi:hypothetical protein